MNGCDVSDTVLFSNTLLRRECFTPQKIREIRKQMTTDRKYVIDNMYDERDKEIVRKMKSKLKIFRIANVMRAIKEMEKHGGVRIRDGRDYADDEDDDLKGYRIDMYGFNDKGEFVILGR